jgi:uncharacterized membrane protein HdeD (DUF308 family)
MSQFSQVTVLSPLQHGIEEVRKRWFWFFMVGLLLILLGTIAIGSSVLMTLATMELIGWLLIGTGLFQIIHAFSTRGWNGFFVDLLSGILSTVVGALIAASPAATAVTLTLLIAMFLIFGGVSRIVVAISFRFPNWIWLLVHGLINLWLGVAIWQEWPFSGLWVIGLFVGIDMIFNGWSLVMLALAAKSLPATEARD